MYWITQDSSSGSDIHYLAKIMNDGSILQVVVVVSVMAAEYAAVTLTPVTTCTIEPSFVILAKYWISLPDDGSCVIRNMLEQLF
jgi:hypothetical protein